MFVLPPTRQQMPDHPAYHEEITGEIAEGRLRAKSGPCFLFRYSEVEKCYQISIKYDDKVMHIKLQIDKDAPSYQLDGSEKNFNSLDDLIKYYQKNALSPAIRKIGQPCRKNTSPCCVL